MGGLHPDSPRSLATEHENLRQDLVGDPRIPAHALNWEHIALFFLKFLLLTYESQHRPNLFLPSLACIFFVKAKLLSSPFFFLCCWVPFEVAQMAFSEAPLYKVATLILARRFDDHEFLVSSLCLGMG